MHFFRRLAVCWPGAQSARDNHLLASNLAKYSPILIFFTGRLSGVAAGLGCSTPLLLEVAPEIDTNPTSIYRGRGRGVGSASRPPL